MVRLRVTLDFESEQRKGATINQCFGFNQVSGSVSGSTRAKMPHKTRNFLDHRNSVSDPDSIRLVDPYPDPDP